MVGEKKATLATSGRGLGKPIKINQEWVVIAISVILFVIFSVDLDKFLSEGNIIALLKNVSILGKLAVGMRFVVVRRGIDLTMVAVMVVGVAFSIWISSWGIDFRLAAACAEIPPIFPTLAIASSIYGSGRIVFASDVLYAPNNIQWLKWIGSGTVFGLPASVIIFGFVAAAMGTFLRKTRFGRLVYTTGDNPSAARNMGLPTRPLIVT